VTDIRIRYPHCQSCARAPWGQMHCHQCKRTQPLDEFYPDRRRGRGFYHGGCKSCRRQQSKTYSRKTYQPRSRAA